MSDVYYFFYSSSQRDAAFHACRSQTNGSDLTCGHHPRNSGSPSHYLIVGKYNSSPSTCESICGSMGGEQGSTPY